MNLADLAREVIEEQTSLRSALSRIRRPAEPPPGWEENTARGVELLLNEAERRSGPPRVEDMGRLAEQAAGLLGAEEGGRVALRVGNLLLAREAPWLARDFLERASAVPWRNETARGEADCWLIRCLAELGEFDRVSELLPRALERARALGEASQEVILLVLAGREANQRGACEQAVQLLGEAIGRSSGIERNRLGGVFGGAPAAFGLRLELGIAARDAGLFEMAIESFERAREMARSDGWWAIEQSMAQELGLTWQLAGAEERSAGDRPTREEKNSPAGTLATAYSLVCDDPPDTEAALYLLQQAHSKIRTTRSRHLEQQYYTVLGRVRAAEGRFNLARVAFDEALHLAVESRRAAQELVCRLNLAFVLMDLRLLAEAQREFETALELGEAVRDEVESTELHRTVTAHLVKVTENLAPFYAHGWRYFADDRPSQVRDPSRLLLLGQRVKAVNLSRWIDLRDEVSGKNPDAAVVTATRQLCGIEAEIERAAMSVGRSLGPIFHRQREVRSGLEARGVATGHRRQAALGYRELGAQLPRSTALIDLISGPQDVFFSCLLPSGEVTCGSVAWPRDERIAFLGRWDASVGRDQRARLPEPPPPGWRLDSDPLRAVRSDPSAATPSRLLEELRASFFEPLLDAAGLADAPRRLLIVPHRELFMLPFGLAADLLRGTRLSLLPNVGCLSLLQHRVRSPAGQRIKIGDATRTLGFVNRELSWLEGFATLEPTLGGIIEGSRDAALVHFAGHGVFDDVNPYDSGLVVGKPLPVELSPDLFKLERGGLHRRLTVAGVLAAVDLPRCRLITLSACCTGLARLEPASEFLSLPAAFLVAGATNVVASLWPVHDGATALLMGEFYRCLDGGAASPSAALHRASLHLRTLPRAEAKNLLGTDRFLPNADPPFASPVYTMAFQHYGVD